MALIILLRTQFWKDLVTSVQRRRLDKGSRLAHGSSKAPVHSQHGENYPSVERRDIMMLIKNNTSLSRPHMVFKCIIPNKNALFVT